MNLFAEQQEKQDRIARLGFRRAEYSKYAWIKLTPRTYAIIEFGEISADTMINENPLGMKHFNLVEGCERLKWEPMIRKYKELLRDEIKGWAGKYDADEEKFIKLPKKVLMTLLCQEASTLSRATYIPCARQAVSLVRNKDRCLYFMCDGCTSHNTKNRGGKLVAMLEEGTFTG